MKILLISGHGAGDPGAMGNGCREADLTRELANMVQERLGQYQGADITMFPQSHNAYADAQKYQLNPGKFDYAFEIHFNAGGGHGTEIHVTTSETGVDVEKKILSKLAGFFTNRGVKYTDFSVIRTLKNQGTPSALLETCFIDSAADMAVWASKKSEIAQAVADGIAEGFGLVKEVIKPGWEQHGSEWKYRFKDGSYKANGWLCLSDGDYLFDKDGWMLKGWQKSGGNWFYLDKNGRCIKDCIYTIPGDDTYAFNARGHMIVNKWVDGKFFGQTGRYCPDYGKAKETCPTCGQEINR